MLQLIKNLFQTHPVYFIDQDAADALFAEMDERNDRALAAEAAAARADAEAERKIVAGAWDELDFDTQCEIFEAYDDLNAQGRLGDAVFYDQWIAARRKAC